MADLFIVGQYDGVASTTAVSIGSQIMHMLTVMIVGLAMGTTGNTTSSLCGEHLFEHVMYDRSASKAVLLLFYFVEQCEQAPSSALRDKETFHYGGFFFCVLEIGFEIIWNI